MLPLLLFILPLGLDTLGVSISLGMKSQQNDLITGKRNLFPTWLISAILFALAETSMPLLGLAIGYTTSLILSNYMHIAGPLVLIGVGLWELIDEGHGYYNKKRNKVSATHAHQFKAPTNEQFQWRRQLLLALSISLDELAVGFSLGSVAVTHGRAAIQPVVICILIGIQGFLMTFIGIMIGRMFRFRMKNLKDMTEFLSALLLIGLGIWLLVA